MRRRRPGLTLIELVVVVMIIGLLLALLVPAVQSSREAARKTICLNNLREIDAAVLHHATVEQVLPSLYNGSFLPQPRHGVDEFHFHSWRSAILPLIEQSSVSASLNFALPATTPSNQTGLNVSIAVFLCPSTNNTNTTVPDILEWNDGKFPVKPVGTAARSDYEIVGGVRVLPQTKSSIDLSNIRIGAWGEPTYDVATGLALRYRKARLADVTDGLSHTLLIAERAGRPDLYRKGEPADPFPYKDPKQAPDYHQAAWGISTHFLWLVYGYDQPVNFTNSTGIFSFHPGGANIALGDGSVRFLTDSTAPAILKALATRSGSEVVDLD
jgi:prepilin-type N-terminal cleavage/methylation domain-containing protein/prepilin-type processing-associated H-X9-DG protein